MPINDLLKQYSDLVNTPPSLEDNNVEGAQGDLHTSEVSSNPNVANKNSDGYLYGEYKFPIINSEVLTVDYGEDTNVSIQINYPVTMFPSATAPGRYGPDLFFENSQFFITSIDQDYVHGTILEIQDITEVTIGSTHNYSVTLVCSIEEGNPNLIESGHIFCINANVYAADTNDQYKPPINLSTSIDFKTGGVYLYWKDMLQTVKRNKIMIRHADHSNIPFYFYIDVFGKTVNPDILVKPFVVGGTIKTMQILSPGLDLITNRSFNIIGTGTGEEWATRLWEDGSLLINEFQIYDVDTVTGDIYCMSNQTKGKLNWPLPYVNSYVSDILPFGSVTNYGILSVTPLTSNRYFKIRVYDATNGVTVIPDATWKSQVIGSKIKTHDGVYKLKTGSGYTSKIQVFLKTLPEDTNAYIDPVIHGNPPGIITTWTGGINATKSSTFYSVPVYNNATNALTDLKVNIKTTATGEILSIQTAQWDTTLYSADLLRINAGWDNKNATQVTFYYVGTSWNQSEKIWAWKVCSYIGNEINKKITTEWSDEIYLQF